MNEIKNPNKTTFVSPNAGLSYGFELANGEKSNLKFVDGVCEVDSNSEIAKLATARYEAQFVDDGKGGRVVSGKISPVPFTPLDQFEASIVRTPIKIEIGKGKYFEVTPEEIQEWHEKAKAFDALPKKKGKDND